MDMQNMVTRLIEGIWNEEYILYHLKVRAQEFNTINDGYIGMIGCGKKDPDKGNIMAKGKEKMI